MSDTLPDSRYLSATTLTVAHHQEAIWNNTRVGFAVF